MTDIVILDVPFSEKDSAKKLGARWNPKIKKWYVPNGLDSTKFSKWIPVEEEHTIALAPIYLVRSIEFCWNCNEATMVHCLAISGIEVDGGTIDEFLTLNYLRSIPEEVAQFLHTYTPNYYMDYTRESDSRYYVNHCSHCRAKLGDFYMHREPEGAFFPTDKTHGSAITIYEITEFDDMEFCGSYSIREPDYILECAAKEIITN